MKPACNLSRLALCQLALAATLALSASPAPAQQTRSLAIRPAATTPTIEAGVRTGWLTRGGTRMAAIDLRLSPGWKTYWRSPGEAGIPPVFDWSASQNLADVRVLWPRPQIFDLNGLRTLGYGGTLVLPIEVTPIDPTRPVVLRVHMELGVCRDVCLPADFAVEAVLHPQESGSDSAISAALAAQPKPGRAAGLSRLTCQVDPIRDGLRVTASMDIDPLGAGPETVVLETEDAGIWVSTAVVTRQGRRLTATSDLVTPSGKPFALNRAGLTVTVVGQTGAVETRGCPAPH